MLGGWSKISWRTVAHVIVMAVTQRLITVPLCRQWEGGEGSMSMVRRGACSYSLLVLAPSSLGKF